MPHLPKFYEGKKVLITGHTGFKGAWLAHMLLGWGAEVTGLSLPPDTNPNLFSLLSLERRVQNNFADIRDLEKVRHIMRESAPAIVLHLAAQALVRKSYDDPMFTFSANVGGTANVLEVAREMGSVRSIVIVTSDKVYTNRGDGRLYTEEDSLGGGDPYSASKAAADIVTQSYIEAFFHRDNFKRTHETLVGIVRAGNVIGGGDWAPDRLIPDLVRAVYEGNGLIRVRNPNSVRPWQHVLEPLCGYVLLAKQLYEGHVGAVGAWNFGPDENGFISVEDVLKRACSIIQKGRYEIFSDTTKPEAAVLALDNGKAKRELAWHPQFTVDGALHRTLSWYKEYYAGNSAPELTDAQIRDFI